MMKWGMQLLRMLPAFVIYLAFGFAGSRMTIGNYEGVILLPSLTVAVLLVYFYGERVILPVLAASILLGFFGIPSAMIAGAFRIPALISIATATPVAAFLGGRYLRMTIKDNFGSIFTISGMLPFLLFVVVIPASLNALLLSIPYLFNVSGSAGALIFLTWFLAGGTGLLLFVPFFLSWSDSGEIHLPAPRITELIVLLLVLVTYLFLISSNLFANPLMNFMLGYFLAPVYIWLAMRFETKITTLVIPATLMIPMVLALMETDHNLIRIVQYPGLMLQGFIFVIVLITLLIHSFINERMNLIGSLLKNESQLKAVIGNMPVALAIVKMNGEGEYVNENFTKLTGYRIEDISGPETWFEKAYPDPGYRRMVKENWKESLKSLPEYGTMQEEFHIVTKDGQQKDVQYTMSALEDRLLIGMSDITQRNRMTGLIVENERRLNTLVQNLQGMLFHCGTGGTRIMDFVSAGARTLTGYTPSDFTGGKISFEALIDDDFRKDVHTGIKTCIETGQTYELQYRITTKDGCMKWVSDKGKAWYDADGNCTGIEGLITDITERISILESLRVSEQRYKSLFENMPLSLWEDDYSGALKYLEEIGAEGITDLQSYLLSDYARIRELIARIRIIDLNRSTIELYGGISKENLLRSPK